MTELCCQTCAQLNELLFFTIHRVARYIPGMAFLLGFNQEEEKNTVQEVSASVTAASADSINVMIKFPELTVCREAFPSPLPPAYFLFSNRTINTFGQA